ncbi:MAG: ATP-binding cassette domain-containing protein [Clostridiales bacterium]|nr:ATP-binding cassette domain-containing protein [Clostridiales bacterium]
MIEVQNVSKRYGQHVALDNVSFTIKDGEVLGFLGPNGAGKSTMMNIITGYISATDGNVKVDGVDILESPEEAKKKIGYLPELPPLYMDMTVEEYLLFVSKIKKVPSDNIEKSLKRIMNVTKITDVRGRLIKNLSKGYKQRVGLAQSIIGNPKVLVLDEPTVGLDPKQIIEIRNLIKELGKQHTIILSSHILPEVSAVCDRVLIINKGKIVASGTPDELSKKLSYSNNLMLRIKGRAHDILNALKKLENIEKIKEQGVREPGTVDVLVEAKKGVDIRESLFRLMSASGLPILMMKSMDLSLEEVFLQVTTQEEGGNVK